jgi:hypothetical protein
MSRSGSVCMSGDMFVVQAYKLSDFTAIAAMRFA